MKKIINAFKYYLNVCIILVGQLFLLLYVLIVAVLPYKCPRCKVRLVFAFEKGAYPNIKKCPHCGEGNFEM